MPLLLRAGAPDGPPAASSTVGGASSTGAPALYIHTLTEPAVEMPEAMARYASAVWLGCEVMGWEGRWGAPGDAVGAAGELGQAQLHPVHAATMLRRGLDYADEGGRVRFAVQLWERQGWQPWSCRP